MRQDLAKYDLIELLAGETWPEIEQAKVIIGFNRALAGYVAEKLNPYFKDEDTEALKELARKPEITPEAVVAFYKDRVPELEGLIEEAILELKRIFLLDVYERKVKEAGERIQSLTDEDLKNIEAKKLELWQQALEAGKQDDWDKVKQVLAVLPR